MIKQLPHHTLPAAQEIQRVFRVSYAIEAELLGATNFPPLQREIENFMQSDTQFFGYYDGASLAAVTEIKLDAEKLHIQSLVVDPAFFRKGIASKLLHFLFDSFNPPMFIVETGADNGPAIALYERHGFILVKQWMTDIGIEKVAFEKRVS